MADRVGATLDPEGIVLLVNWRGRSGDPCTGDEAAGIFIERARTLFVMRRSTRRRYRLDLLSSDVIGCGLAAQ